ncbi:MAG: HAMP domain-containing protein [Firmicutes bacterium]|nr:HAMP domain-containing protein [Bacillota bacterium]
MARKRSIWRRVRVAGKVGGGFAAVLLLMAFVAFLGMRAVNEAVQSFDRLLEADTRSAVIAERLELLTANAIAGVLEYFLPPSTIAAMQEEWLATWDELSARLPDPEDQALLATVRESHAAFFALSQEEFAAFAQQEELQNLAGQATADVRSLVEHLNGRVEATQMESRKAAQLAEVRIAAAAAVALVVGIVLAVMLTRLISRPLVALSAVAGQVAAGDLTVEISSGGQEDEVGQLAEAFGRMTAGLRSIVQQVTQAVDTLNASSGELSSSAEEAARVTQEIARTIEQVAAGTGEQSRTVQEVVGAVAELKKAIDRIASGAREQARVVDAGGRLIGEMMQSVQAVAESARHVAAASDESVKTAQRGGQTVRQTVAGMEGIHNTVFATADKVRQLGVHSQKVGEIVQVISDIAEQTNLLALNAAIEAARAGEHGKGFAVVADEVRKLAERSASSAKEIASLINDMKTGIDEAVQAMQAGTQEVASGTEQAKAAGQALDEIMSTLESTNQRVQAITRDTQSIAERVEQVMSAVEAVARITEDSTAAAEEMAARSEQVVSAMESISAVSEETAASSEEVSASAEEMNASVEGMAGSARGLSEMAGNLKQLVAQFRT